MIPLTETTDVSSTLGFLYPREKLKWGRCFFGGHNQAGHRGVYPKAGAQGAGGRAPQVGRCHGKSTATGRPGQRAWLWASPAALRDLLKDFKQGMTGSDLHVRNPLQQPCRRRIQERRETPGPGPG